MYSTLHSLSNSSYYHFIISGVPGLSGDLCFAFWGFLGVWKQVHFNIWVRVCSIIRHLKRCWRRKVDKRVYTHTHTMHFIKNTCTCSCSYLISHVMQIRPRCYDVMFTSHWRKKKCDLRDFVCGMNIGTRLAIFREYYRNCWSPDICTHNLSLEFRQNGAEKNYKKGLWVEIPSWWKSLEE